MNPSVSSIRGRDRWRQRLSGIAIALYAVPLCTYALTYFYNQALIVTRPVKIILGTGLLAILSTLPCAPVMTPAISLLGLLLGLRFLDAALLRRTYDPTGYAVSITGYAIFVIIVFACFCADKRRMKLVAPFIIIPSLVVSLGSIYWDFIFSGTFSTVIGRAAGFFGNSNDAALAVTVFCSYLMGCYAQRPIVSLFWMVSGLAGTFVTYSRGGFALMILAAGLFVFRVLSWKKALIWPIVIFFSVYGLSWIVRDAMTGNANVINRIAVMTGQKRLDLDDSGRLTVLRDAIDLSLQKPLDGFGATYCSAPDTITGQGPHNMFIGAWMDSGVVGLLLYTAAVTVMVHYVWKRSRAYFPLAAVLGASSLFSHDLLGFAPFLIGWVLVVFVARYQQETAQAEHPPLRPEAFRRQGLPAQRPRFQPQRRMTGRAQS